MQRFVPTIVVFALGFIYSATSLAALQTYGIVGDAGEPSPAQQQTRRSLARHEVFQLIMPGDNLYDLSRTYEEVWGPWRTDGFQFPVVALGNHTLGYEEEIQYFRLPGEFYSYTRNGLRFIVLNSDNRKHIARQIDFLQHELETARERFVFLVFHHPPFTLTQRHHWKEREDFQKGVRALLRKHSERLTGVIVGHDHIASLLDIDGLPLIVSGSAFEQIPTRPLDYRDGGFHVKTRWLFRGQPHWVRLDADPLKPHVWLNFIEVGREIVACSARIYPRPIQLRENCGRTTSRAKVAHAPLKQIPRVHNPR